ncbi:MAG: hypothetical protein AB7I36_01180 [Rhodospirillaceae bacterium]
MTRDAAIQRIAQTTGQALAAAAHSAAQEWPAETLAALEERLVRTPEGDELRVELLSLIAAITESRGRQAHGLSATHGASLKDFGYSFARKELEAVRDAADAALQRTGSTNMAIALAESYVGLGDLGGAERIYAILRAENVEDLTSCTTFDKTFHAGLPAAADRGFSQFPAVRTLVERAEPCEQIVWVACDRRYFELYGDKLLGSFIAQRGGAKLALHIMDAGAAGAAISARLRPYTGHIYQVTAEDSGRNGEAARAYYHAVRYIRFYEFLRAHAGIAWLWDVDTIVAKNIAPLFSAMNANDVGFWILPGRPQPRSMIAAGYVGARVSPSVLDYFGRIAAYIAHFAATDRLAWGIDQVALYACLTWTAAKLRIVPLPEQVFGRPDSMLLVGK